MTTKTAQPQATLVSALSTITQHLGDSPWLYGVLSEVSSRLLQETTRIINGAALIDPQGYANLSALVGAASYTALVTSSTNDTTDTALATAKGSAVAVGDLFAVNSGRTAVTYLGSSSASAFETSLKTYTSEGYEAPNL